MKLEAFVLFYLLLEAGLVKSTLLVSLYLSVDFIQGFNQNLRNIWIWMNSIIVDSIMEYHLRYESQIFEFWMLQI